MPFRLLPARSPLPLCVSLIVALAFLLSEKVPSADAFTFSNYPDSKVLRASQSAQRGSVNGMHDISGCPPRHVAFICDGNSRWARAKGLPPAAGHAAGAESFVNILDTLKDAGVEYCTMYGFSTENWKRSRQEIQDILSVVERSAHVFYNRALRENLRIRVLGDMTDERIPQSLREILARLEKETSQGDKKLTLCLAINYGGRRDIVEASKRLAQSVLEGNISVDDITETSFAEFLSTSGIPDPELIIRTSGESRISNFLNWNAAYSELYFTDVLWPDFDDSCAKEALDWYSMRRRRFGARTPEESGPAIRC